MRLKGRQARFVFGTIGAWGVGRGGALWWGWASVAVVLVAQRDVSPAPPAWPHAAPPPLFHPGADPSWWHRRRAAAPDAAGPMPLAPPPLLAPVPDSPAGLLRLAAARYYPGSTTALLRHATFSPAPRPQGDAAPILARAPAAPAGRSRLSVQSYLFVRPGSGRAALAADGALGGSQAAARLAWRLNGGAVTRTAIVARVYAPLAAKGAEAALGMDWYPVAAVPLRISVERRFDLDGRGRSAWSAYAAGGFYLEQLDGRVALDGYGQGGVVGAERRDLFVDGALRAGRRARLAGATVTAGAGLWGAAQPGVARLDVGPRVAATVPVARTLVSVALEGRFRVAGRASPGSGLAFTLSSQF